MFIFFPSNPLLERHLWRPTESSFVICASFNLTVREAAGKINKSVGWLSAIENRSGTARITETEFDRVVAALGGSEHKAMFRTWVASHVNASASDRTFDGAVLKYIRIRQKISIRQASKLTKLSCGYISKIETGLKPVTFEMRNRVMVGCRSRG